MVVVVVCKPILVFSLSLSQAEQLDKRNKIQNKKYMSSYKLKHYIELMAVST